MGQESTIKKGVEITFGGSERKPGGKIREHLLDIRTFSDRILERIQSQLDDMADDNKHLLEEKLADISSDLIKISDNLADNEE